MLETSNLALKYKSICSFRKFIFLYQGPLNFADITIFLQKISVVWQKAIIYLYSKQQCESYVRDIIALFSVFVRKKVTINENIIFIDYESVIWLPDCFKLTINWKNDYDVQFFLFSYWSKSHVNITIASVVMTIFFYKGLARNSEIRNTPVWVLPDIWRLVRVKDTKFGTNIFNKILLNPEKCQGYRPYHF